MGITSFCKIFWIVLQTADLAVRACGGWGLTLQKDCGVFVCDTGNATRLILEDVASQGDQAIRLRGQDFTESHTINKPLL